MTIQDLIAIANEAYPDNMIANSFDPVTGKPLKKQGDSLAYFIVQELIETFEHQAPASVQLTEAARAIYVAAQELTSVTERLKYAESILDIPKDQVALYLTASESEPIKKLLETRLKGDQP